MKSSLFYFLVVLMMLGCHLKDKPKDKAKTKTQVDKPEEIAKNEPKKPIIYQTRVLAIKDVLVNGYQIILPIKKFNSLYKNIDSSRTTLWECGDPFEWLDEKWMKTTYGNKIDSSGTFENYDGHVTTLFGKGIEFNTNKHIVLFDNAFAKFNSFEIPSHHIVLNGHTSLEDFKRIFPLAKMETLEDSGEIRCRFYLEAAADDAFLLYFKNGKLNYFKLWFLLC